MGQTNKAFASAAEAQKEGNDVLTSLGFTVKIKGNKEFLRIDMETQPKCGRWPVGALKV